MTTRQQRAGRQEEIRLLYLAAWGAIVLFKVSIPEVVMNFSKLCSFLG